MTKLYDKGDKRFLNDLPDEGGSISWGVATNMHTRRGFVSTVADITLRDCYKTIDLTFFNRTPAEYKERLAKVDQLLDSLTKFRASLIEAREARVKGILKYRQENKGERFNSKRSEEILEE